MTDLAKLRAPFPPDRVSWRVGSANGEKTKGMALCYIDARDVQDRLDEACGPDWQCRYVPMHDKKTVCEIGIKIDGEWVWRADGAGDSDVEAEKGALSDAFKRAAVRWGVGRYLYDIDSPWVALEAAGRSYKIAAGEYERLRKVLGGAKPAPEPKPAPAPKPPNAAAGWVSAREVELRNIRTKADMATWCKKNAPALDKLLTTDKALYNAINLKIALRNDELEAMAAA